MGSVGRDLVRRAVFHHRIAFSVMARISLFLFHTSMLNSIAAQA
jgi:hypothetical protein